MTETAVLTRPGESDDAFELFPQKAHEELRLMAIA